MKSDDKPIPPNVLAALAQVDEVQQQVRDVANTIKRDAAILAPVTTGRLKRNIEIERVVGTDRRPYWIVGWNKKSFYGLMVEEGTEERAPRPHLVPAAIKNGAVAPSLGGDE